MARVDARVLPDRAATAVRHAAGLLEFAGRVGGEITALVQEVHAASSPLAWLRGDGRPAWAVYGSIQLGFRAASGLAALGGRLAPADPPPDAWLDVQSVLNGAFGHLFDGRRGAFALPMSLRRPPSREPAERTLVFLHGLCMNERAWVGPAHAAFARWARETLAAEVAYLRYNTGLRISSNGAALAALLEREALTGELVLVGHSMGGLVARSALHQARERGMRWPGRLRGLACLGTPHEGASLERLGNHANRLLELSPWTRPFMRLGELRSDGIRDLRFGHLLDEDWRDRPRDDTRPAWSAAPWPDDVDHLLVAAVRRGGADADPIGDWLVSVGSAWARNAHPTASARRELVRGLDHIGLLADERVYGLLRSWLAELAAP
jgi:pimeloyl-ACP methyl ester carboxylesterase